MRQVLPDFSVSFVQTKPKPVSIQRGIWYGPYMQDAWCMGTIGWKGMHAGFVVDGKRSKPFPRPPNTWHVTAPFTGYMHMDESAESHQDDYWFSYQFNAPFPPFTDKKFIAVYDPENRLGNYLRTMVSLYESRAPGASQLLHAYAALILVEMNAAGLRGAAGTPEDPWVIPSLTQSLDSSGKLLEQVDREINKNLTYAPSIQELAKKLNLSPSSLIHRFKRETGMTVMDRVRWLRIQEARSLLARPGLSVKAAAEQLGFSSPFHFSRVFKQEVGVSPKNYIRQCSAQRITAGS